MKNDKIIASWDKIEPDDPANRRMLSAILGRNRAVHDRHNGKGKVISMSYTAIKARRMLPPAAVCLIALIAAVGIVGGWFGPKDYTVGLANGDSVIYRNGSMGFAAFNFDFPVSTRELTEDELGTLFPATTESRSAMGTFREDTGTLIRVEGKIGTAAVIFASDGIPLNDVVIQGNETEATVNGVPVSAGYFITGPSSKGKRNAIFFGTFTLGSTDIYIECSGGKSDADEVSRRTAEWILRLVENGEPNLSAVKK